MLNFKKDYTKRKLFGAALILIGITLVIIMFAFQPDYSDSEMVFYCVLGLIVTIAGIYHLIRYKVEDAAHEMDFSDEFAVPHPYGGRFGVFIEKFRNDLAGFFLKSGIEENNAVQYDTTQIFNNSIDRQKKRLDNLGVKMEFRSVRRKYTSNPVRVSNYFDGKYSISDIDEEIEAKRRYSLNGRRLFTRNSSQIAHYTVLDAKRVGDSDRIVCPNCGNETTRENLIDGCDFCKTKFTVEDLGSKISAFAFRDKYEIAYAKYKTNRFTYASNAIMAAFFVIYFFILFCFVILLFDDPGSGDPESPIFWVFSFLSMAGCFAMFFAFPFAVFYMVVIFPALNIGASFKYNSRRKLQALKEEENADRAFMNNIRKSDPLFSTADFRSNIRNKLSGVIFANNKAEINTFSDIDLSSYLSKYHNVIDYDIDRIEFLNYDPDCDGLQKIDLNMQLRLFTLNGNKIKNRREQLRLTFSKSSDCKTQAVCAPSIMRCKNCGSSLSFANGLTCEYCGSHVDLKKYDWMITALS